MNVPLIPLNDGRSMPQVGFGVWQVSSEQIGPALASAFDVGYRSIDTAAAYENEEGVGRAVRASGLAREELFITTKLWNPRHGEPLEALDESLQKLEMDYVDLYLIHWPVPRQDKYLHAWEGLIRAREQGKVRSIGVSNFLPGHLERIVEATGVVPAVNQIELHPLFPQAELREVHREFGIVTESWSPLGRGRLDESEILARIAQKHGKSPAQIVLRWHVELGLIVIPKSVTPSRIRENFELFDFALDADDMAAIQSLDQGTRLGGDPAVAAYGVNL